MTAPDAAIAWATATAALITEQTGNVAEVKSREYASVMNVWVDVSDLSGLPTWVVVPSNDLGQSVKQILRANSRDRQRGVKPPSREQAAHDAARTAELNDPYDRWQFELPSEGRP